MTRSDGIPASRACAIATSACRNSHRECASLSRAKRQPASLARRAIVEIEILTHRVAIDLDRDTGARHRPEDLVPVRLYARARSEDAATRMREHVNAARLHRSDHPRGLVVARSQLGVRRHEHEFEPRELLCRHVD